MLRRDVIYTVFSTKTQYVASITKPYLELLCFRREDRSVRFIEKPCRTYYFSDVIVIICKFILDSFFSEECYILLVFWSSDGFRRIYRSSFSAALRRLVG